MNTFEQNLEEIHEMSMNILYTGVCLLFWCVTRFAMFVILLYYLSVAGSTHTNIKLHMHTHTHTHI